MNKYDIAKEFTAGLVAALTPAGIDESKSPYWQAGYEAGYEMRAEKNRRLNEYLVSLGSEPMAVVKLCEKS